MKQKKLFYITTIVLLVVVLAGGLFYRRPLNMWEITGIAEPEEISAFILRRDGDEGLEARVDLLSVDEGFDALLERLEKIQFRRPPTNLIRIAIPLPGLPGFYDMAPKKAEAGEFQRLNLYLRGTDENGEIVDGWVTFEVDQWQYYNYDREVHLNLVVTDSKETGQTLCAELWETAPQIISYS